MQNYVKNYKPEGFKEEPLSLVVFDKIKEIDFDDTSLMENISHLTQTKIESIAVSNRAKESVNKKIKI